LKDLLHIFTTTPRTVSEGFLGKRGLKVPMPGGP